MRIFKLAKLSNAPSNYLSIGHRENDDVTLWVIGNDLRFYQREISNPSEEGHDVFPGSVFNDAISCGRLDNLSGKTSATPLQPRFLTPDEIRKIVKITEKILQEQFGDIKVVWFAVGDNKK
jgi:hypothetical protein